MRVPKQDFGGIHTALGRQPGFISVDVIHHADQLPSDYLLLVKFVRALTPASAPTHAPAPKTRLPAFWKSVVLSISLVYPMIVLLDWLLDPIIGGLPTYAQIFVIVVALSTLLTWPIMPCATRLLKGWLDK